MPIGNQNNPPFSRQSLREVTKFTEGDYRGINPREFFRSLNRSIGEIKDGNGFKYSTSGGPTESLRIIDESVGSKTGTVVGWLKATSDEKEIGEGSINYRRYGPHGAWLILIGLLTSIFVVGLVLIPIGIWLYLKEERGELPLLSKDEIRVLMNGEVSERTIEESGGERTDIFANISVIFAGDTFVRINQERLEEFDLAHRKAIVRKTQLIHNAVIDEERHDPIEVYSGKLGEFIRHLRAFSNSEVRTDEHEITNVENLLNSDEEFEYRIEYSERLLGFLPSGYNTELEEHQEEIMEELEDLAQDMDVYVEREGLQET